MRWIGMRLGQRQGRGRTNEKREQVKNESECKTEMKSNGTKEEARRRGRGKSTDSRVRIWTPQGRMRRVCARERYEARGVCRVSAEARKN
jgi:hypothetical protein